MDMSTSEAAEDRISELPDTLLHECLSLLEMKNAAQTSILSRRWRHMWTHHLTNLDFDPASMYPTEYSTFETHKAEYRKYFAWINQVVSMHRGPRIVKFRVHFHYYSSLATQLGKWVKFALSKRVKELVLHLIGQHLRGNDYSNNGFPFGFDMLRHPPCYTGITALQSLHLSYVDVSQEFIEFLLFHCRHLERLVLSLTTLYRLIVRTSKLKYLTIMVDTRFEYLEIDAANLLYFRYGDNRQSGHPCMVFKSLPMLVETDFRGGFCMSPFPIFNKLDFLYKQLNKLTLEFDAFFSRSVIPEEVVIPTFPNVKHFTCALICYDVHSILPVKRLIKACPMLEVFKLLYESGLAEDHIEASELQEIDLENEKATEEMNNSQIIGLVQEGDMEEQHHTNLRIVELIGFVGASFDVQLALAIARYATSLETIICDPGGVSYSCFIPMMYWYSNTQFEEAKRRARKLAKIVAPKVTVMII